MTILTPAEAANYCRTQDDDALMLQLMEQVDAYIERATGRDWTQDTNIHPIAKAAASVLLIHWYDDPAQMGNSSGAVSGLLLQLEAEALKYRKYIVYGLSNAGGIYLNGALEGDEVIKVTGIYNVSGDQSANFESVISANGQIQQTTSADLSNNLYVLILKHPSEDVTA